MSKAERDRRYREKNRDKIRAQRAANAEHIRAVRKAYNDAHKEQNRAYAVAYYARTREKQIAYALAWQAANPDKAREIARRYEARVRAEEPERIRAWKAKTNALPSSNAGKAAWRRANLDKVRAAQVMRRVAQYSATPTWANRFFMAEAYRLARQRTQTTGIKWEVDHIIPLRGRNVCGLHTHTNLQVIPATVNRRKSNRVPHA